MNDKETFDACMKIAEFGANNFHGRRNFEWKISLGYWALLAASIAFVRQHPEWIANRPNLFWFAPVSVIGFVIFWLRGVWVANTNDKAIADHFLFEAEKIFHDPEYVPKKIPPKIAGCQWAIGFLADWSAWFQIITTAFLASIFYFVTRP